MSKCGLSHFYHLSSTNGSEAAGIRWHCTICDHFCPRAAMYSAALHSIWEPLENPFKEISYLALFGLRVYGSVDRNVPNLGTRVLGYFRNYSANLLLLVL